jgi:RHS repeat-associated protein
LISKTFPTKIPSPVEDDTVNRFSQVCRLPSAYTLFNRLSIYWERFGRLAGRRGRKSEKLDGRARLNVEAMEERVVPDSRPLPNPAIFAGSGPGQAAMVNAYAADTGNLTFSVPVYGSHFKGGVHIATADFTGDGIPDVVVVPGAGRSPLIQILDGTSGKQIAGPLGSFMAFGKDVRGGVYVAAADVNGDGTADVIAAAETAQGPVVKVFSGTDGHLISRFVVTGTAFREGISITAADFSGSGKADVVVAAGGSAQVRTYDPLTGKIVSGPLGSFQAFGGKAGAVYVDSDSLAGSVDGDGKPDLVLGTRSGVARVEVVDGQSGNVQYDFKPFGKNTTGGARVALAYVDNDSHADIIVGTGKGQTDAIKVFSGATGQQLPTPMGSYSPFGKQSGGVVLAASNDPIVMKRIPMLAVAVNDGSPASLPAGEPFTIAVNSFGNPAITGTVTFTVTPTQTQAPTVTVGTEPMIAGGLTNEYVTAPLSLSLAAGTYTITANYSGDANYTSTSPTSSITITAPASSTPPDVAPGDNSSCPCVGPVATPIGDGVATRAGMSSSGVAYGTGGANVTRSDLSSSAMASPWAQTWNWTNISGYSDGSSGSGATETQAPHLVQVNGNNSIAMVSNATTAHFFDSTGSAYAGRFGDTSTVSHDTTNGVFIVTDGTGQKYTFYDYSMGTPSGRAGKLKSMTDANGNLTQVTSWNSSGQPTEVQQTEGSGSSAITSSFVYSYVASGVNAGLLAGVTERTQVGGGSWTTIRQTSYTYYDGTTANGLAGELKLALVQDASGNTINTSYYRYYTSGMGSSGNIKYALGTQAYANLTAALGTNVDSLSDTQVTPYADKYLAYDSAGRVTTAVNASAGCSVCSGGQGTFTYSYTTNSMFSGVLDPNSWQTKTVETQPDGTTNTVYTNAFGQVMLKVYTDISGNQWMTYNRYDSQGRLILTADPSAVSGYSESYSDLVNFNGGGASYLRSSDGFITTYTFGSTTTATSSTAGDVAGYLKAIAITHGQTGTPIPQETFAYISNTAAGNTVYELATGTKYRNTDGTGGTTTNYSYTYQPGTNQIASVTTTYPTITAAENGSGTATTATKVFDQFGRIVWTKDASGVINYSQYDDLTGAVVKHIVDVNTADTSEFTNLPAGWTTPAGGGANLITTYQVDGLGRVTKQTSPNGNVTYTVYDDADHEVRTYAGWNSSTNTPTGPTTVTRQDLAGGYTETLTMTAPPAVSGGVPTGTEPISDVQSLSRTYTNSAGQVVYKDDYFNLGGLAYSTAANIGTQNVNFYRTTYQYDTDGNLCKSVSPQGTISRTVYDGQGRVVSEWVGTNDTPTSGWWSPSNPAGMVETKSYQYDNGGVGDGNLTQETDYPGGGAANRVTDFWYDWEDRQVAQKDGVETNETDSVNRPLIVNTYDNLNDVTEVQQYDGDGVTPSIVSGVLSLPAGTSTDLRAQTTTSYDELGRAYRTDTYDVNPITGAVGANTLHSLTYYDPRGYVIESAAPDGSVTKNSYDGAGRLTATYTTDGGGGTSYAAASSVSNDTVLEQTLNTYDGDGNRTLSTTSQRFDNATGTGALGSPTSGIGARVSYVANYYDAADRLIATVDVGTNGGTAYTPPSTVPARSDTVLVTSNSYAADAVQTVKLTGSPTGGTFTLTFGGQTTGAIAFNASASTVQSALAALSSIGTGNVVVTPAVNGGWEVRFTGTLGGVYQSQMTADGTGLSGGTSPTAAVSTLSLGGDAGNVVDVTDPKGLDTRTYSDPMGRAVQSINDFTDGTVTTSSNKTTDYTYNGVGMTSMTAEQTGGTGQTTQWVYGVTQTGASGIDSNDIVGAIEYPDPTTGLPSSSQEATTTVNALGETSTATDRNGNTHTYAYDVLGRVTSDAVTTLGSGVDGSVRRIDTAYDGQGNAYLVTSYDSVTGGNIVNQVERTFNSLGQMTDEYQSHSGAVNTSTTPEIQYAYSEMSGGANSSRLTSITYPSGYVLNYNYSSGLNNTISRLSSVSDFSGTVESYKYLGLATVVERDHPTSGVNQTFISQTGATGDAGDQYTGLDRFGRVVEQNWYDPSTTSSVSDYTYGYDRDSNVLYKNDRVNSSFGELYGYDNLSQLTSFQRGTLNGTNTALTGTPSVNEAWSYDALGNRTSNTVGSTTTTETANAQNEITSVSGATTPTYDANGNMTTDQNGLHYVYDAWNQLVAVKDSSGNTLETYSYDGLGHSITNTVSGTTKDLYYSDQGQVLEEATGGQYTTRYAWSPVYVNAMIFRETDTSGTGLTATGTSYQRLWPTQDANWNITAIVNDSGTVVERYAYDPFGAVTVMDAGYGSRSSSSFGWIYNYQGMRYDAVSGLDKADERWYSPTLGTWTTTDPSLYLAGDVNLYRFVGDDPGSHTDPSGLEERPSSWPPGKVPNPNPPSRASILTGTYQFWIDAPVEPDRPIDPKKDVKDYNCAGLAFRDYKYWSKADVLKKLKECKEGDLKKDCPDGFGLKVIYYDITAVQYFKDGKMIKEDKIDDFHIVGMIGSGDRCCSKNGKSPIEGPGPIDSFPPNQPYPPPKLPDGVTLKPVYTTKVFCCPTK